MLPTRPFGSTGHASTRVIFGAAALGAMSQSKADATLQVVADSGINHIDTAAGYGDSELRLRPWLADNRASVFLATKTGDRNGSDARSSLERSLERMGVDSVDLIQLHNLVEDAEWREAFGPGGALSALVQARDEGLCRFIGVTGHGLRICLMHLRSLEQHPFDSVLFPLNHVLMTIDEYRRDAEQLLAVCEERNVAAQTIKAVARRRWPDEDTGPHRAWYEPLNDPAVIERAVHYVLSRPEPFLLTSSDATVLPAIVSAATTVGSAPTPKELEADRLAHGITPLFDGTDLERI